MLEKIIFSYKRKKSLNKKAGKIKKILIILGIFIFSFFKKLNVKFKSTYRNNFQVFFPKINLKDTKIPSLEEIFNSNHLFISDINLTNEYIHYLRPINEEEEKKYNQKLYENITPNEFWNRKRPNQYSFEDFYNLSCKGKLINSEKFEYTKKPIISVIIPSFNKEKEILKSVRSIQNQSLKNIEIIIIDDASNDNSKVILNNLINEDHRIRVFSHLKNMGLWRSRLDGFLYSRAKYILHFDMADEFTDNYVLEDSYSLVQKYQLDSVRFSFINSRNFSNPYSSENSKMEFSNEYRKIIYGERKFDVTTFIHGPIWNRLTRANIMTKGLYLLDPFIINAYKNMWDDRWWNSLINKMSFSFLMINRLGYLYLVDGKGEGTIRLGDKLKNDKLIHEFIYFWLFDLKLLPQEDNKQDIIRILKDFNNKNNKYFDVEVNLGYILTKFPPYEYLLTSLIKDNYVLNKDKKFVKKLLNKYRIKFLS